LFVGIGCPRQEKWMAKHSKKLNLVMLGVGAAFDFHSGRVKQSPSWMQKLSLEWLFRLGMEPKRLWKRYLFHNPRFMLYFLFQYIIYKLQLKKP
jgi:N-acetylglucosaminyldiphosphoundecaprenol N-acetyl-beta-D-mannosaminyltransferase